MPEYTRTAWLVRNNWQALHSSVFNNLDTVLRDDGSETEEVECFLYEERLNRSFLSKGSVIGLGFGLMSPVLGMSSTMSIGLLNGGPLTIMGGFLICGIATWFCSLSLGEIISKYPIEIHGGSAMLAPARLKLICSWYTGWLMLLGNWAMSTSITFAGAQLLVSLIALTNENLIKTENVVLHTVLAFYVIVTLVGVVNLKLARFIETINKVCVYWIIYAIIFIDILLLLFHSGNYRSLKFALMHFDNRFSGHQSVVLSFLIGFQQSSFTLQGFSMLTAVSDEVQRPERDIPHGMSTAVLISWLAGIVFLLPIMLILPDPQTILDNPKIAPVVLIFTQSTHSMFVSFFLVLMILGNLLFSGIGSITTSSRAVYSMARDSAMPYSEIWTYIDESSASKVPKFAVLLSMAVSYILGLLALISTAAFNAFIGAAIICLCSATCIPFILVMVSKRQALQGAPIKVKRGLGWVLNIANTLWLLLTIVVICVPVKMPVSFSTMNYASLVYAFFLVCITALYYMWGKLHFKTPLVKEHIPLQSPAQQDKSKTTSLAESLQ
ncbi:LAMI_0G13036g1_1 [Lachancea mirantina]|uniref:LAMI_0G13036g1_1 n=1 Tax=Lachancea mirantina TaxID=1230905 RepID=A0A1G4KBJ1_9SACH|nr:LAMI_0G13036g1_1 [Lachancea mirantina]